MCVNACVGGGFRAFECSAIRGQKRILDPLFGAGVTDSCQLPDLGPLQQCCVL